MHMEDVTFFKNSESKSVKRALLSKWPVPMAVESNNFIKSLDWYVCLHMAFKACLMWKGTIAACFHH